MQNLRARNIVEVSQEMIKDDPFVFVRNRNEVIAWIKNGKREEIANLQPDEDAELN